jgi:hypothetical protein
LNPYSYQGKKRVAEIVITVEWDMAGLSKVQTAVFEVNIVSGF